MKTLLIALTLILAQNATEVTHTVLTDSEAGYDQAAYDAEVDNG